MEQDNQQMGQPGGSVAKNLPASAADMGSSPESGRSLEKEMATYSKIVAWKIPRIEEPGGLQSMGSQKNWTRLSDQKSFTVSTLLY